MGAGDLPTIDSPAISKPILSLRYLLEMRWVDATVEAQRMAFSTYELSTRRPSCNIAVSPNAGWSSVASDYGRDRIEVICNAKLPDGGLEWYGSASAVGSRRRAPKAVLW